MHHQVIPRFVADRQFFELEKLADAVVAVNHEISRLHFARVDGAAGCLAAAAHIAAGGEGMLAEKFPIGNQHQLPGRQLEPLQFGGASVFQGHRCGLLHQSIDGWEVGGIGHKAGDAVVLLQQGHRPRGLGRDQPHRGFLSHKALHQGGQLAKGVRVGGHRAGGQIKAVGVAVGFQQFGQIKAPEGFRLLEGAGWLPMQHPGQRAPQLAADLSVVSGGVVKPLLGMGETLAPAIDSHQGVGAEVIEQGGRLVPGQAHQPPHPLGGAALQQLVEGLRLEQQLQPIRHRLSQRVGNQGAVAAGGQAHHLDGIEGALGCGVKFPQLVELLAKKLQPHGEFAAHREDIDDVAAATPAALLLDRGHPLVTKPAQGFAQLLEADGFALAQTQALGPQGLGRGQVGLQGPLGGHDGQASCWPIDQLAEHLQLAPGDLAGGIKGLVGAGLAGGVELAAGPTHQLQQRRPAARLLQGRHDHQQRRPRGAGHGAADQGPGGPTAPGQPQSLGPRQPCQHLAGEGCLLQLAHQGGEGHGRIWQQLAPIFATAHTEMAIPPLRPCF